MKTDQTERAALVKEMLANPKQLYSRLHTGFAMSYGETASLRELLRIKAAMLRTEADAIDIALQAPSEAASWYETISAERDEAVKETVT